VIGVKKINTCAKMYAFGINTCKIINKKASKDKNAHKGLKE